MDTESRFTFGNRTTPQVPLLMVRSAWKGPFVDFRLFKAVLERKLAGRMHVPIETMSRRSTIVSEFVGCVFAVYNGKVFNRVHINPNMIGHKLGEFSLTRKYPVHPVKKNK